MGRGLKASAVGACALLLVACGGSDRGNAPAASPSVSATSTTAAPRPVVDRSLLDVGQYPTAPRPPLGLSGNPALGAAADAQHLADFVLGPWEVDDALVGTYLNTYYVLNSASVLKQLGPEDIATAAGQNGMINGFASARQSSATADGKESGQEVMVNAVLRFPDPGAATAASAAMGEAAMQQAIKGVTPTTVAIPGHPDADASTYPFTPNGSTQPRATVRSFTPRGPYVFMHFVQTVDGQDRATALVGKMIDAQGPAIDGFTPAADLAAVPLDPTGLLAKTMPRRGDRSRQERGVHQPGCRALPDQPDRQRDTVLRHRNHPGCDGRHQCLPSQGRRRGGPDHQRLQPRDDLQRNGDRRHGHGAARQPLLRAAAGVLLRGSGRPLCHRGPQQLAGRRPSAAVRPVRDAHGEVAGDDSRPPEP